MARISVGIYHDPLIWIEHEPINRNVSYREVDPRKFDEQVARIDFPDHITLTASVEGLFRLDIGDKSTLAPAVSEGVQSLEDFDKAAEAVLRRMRLMNAYLALFYTEQIEINSAFSGRMVATPDVEIVFDGNSQSFGSSEVARLAGTRYLLASESLPLTDHRLAIRPVIPLVAVEGAAHKLIAIMADEGKAENLLLCELFSRASKGWQDHDYDISLIIYWACLEKLVDRLWSRLLSDKFRHLNTTITKERAKRLADIRTFSAAVRIETLSMLGHIDDDTYAKLSTVRKARNNWIHNLRAASPDIVDSARRVTETLFEISGITLRGWANRQIHI